MAPRNQPVEDDEEEEQGFGAMPTWAPQEQDWVGPNPWMQQQMISMALGQPGYETFGGMYPTTFSMPQLSNFGQVIPVGSSDLKFEKDAANLYQDWQDIQFSPENMFMAGAAGLDPKAFEDKVSYEVVDRPGTEWLRQQLPIGGPATTFSGMVAEEIFFAGGSGQSAMAKARRAMQAMEEAGTTDSEEYQALKASLPSLYDDFGQEIGIDWNQARSDAISWEEKAAEDEQAGTMPALYDAEGNMMNPSSNLVLRQDAEGNEILVRETREPSEIAQQFAEAGLPSPFEEYNYEDFLSQDWSAGADAYAATAQEVEAMKQALDVERGRYEESVRLSEDPNVARRGMERREEEYHRRYESGELPRVPGERRNATVRTSARNPNVEDPRSRYSDVANPNVATRGADNAFTLEPGPGGPAPAAYNRYNPRGIGSSPDAAEGVQQKPGESWSKFQARRQATAAGPLEMPTLNERMPTYEQLVPETRYGFGKNQGPPTLADIPEAVGNQAGNRRDALAKSRDRYKAAVAQREEEKRRVYGADYGKALAMQLNLRDMGRTPYSDVVTARRMVPYAGGMGGTGMMPGQG